MGSMKVFVGFLSCTICASYNSIETVSMTSLDDAHCFFISIGLSFSFHFGSDCIGFGLQFALLFFGENCETEYSEEAECTPEYSSI